MFNLFNVIHVMEDFLVTEGLVESLSGKWSHNYDISSCEIESSSWYVSNTDNHKHKCRENV